MRAPSLVLVAAVAAAVVLAAAPGRAAEASGGKKYGGHSTKFDPKDLDLLLDPTFEPLPPISSGHHRSSSSLPPLNDNFFGSPIKAFPTRSFPSTATRASAHGAAAAATERMASKTPASYPVKDPETDCRFELDGDEFDLSPLRLDDGARPYAAKDHSGFSYLMNFCGTMTAPTSACARSNGMICQLTPGPNPSLDGVIARWTAHPEPVWSYIDDRRPDAGVKMVVRNGDDCSFRGSHKTRESIVFFPCDPRAGKIGQISVSESSTCVYVINVPTSLSCPGEAGSSWGWHFITLLLVGSALYLALGYLYVRYRTGAEGIDALPNREFWLELPGLVKDGMAFTYERFTFYKGEWQASKAGNAMPVE